MSINGSITRSRSRRSVTTSSRAGPATARSRSGLATRWAPTTISMAATRSSRSGRKATEAAPCPSADRSASWSASASSRAASAAIPLRATSQSEGSVNPSPPGPAVVRAVMAASGSRRARPRAATTSRSSRPAPGAAQNDLGRGAGAGGRLSPEQEGLEAGVAEAAAGGAAELERVRQGEQLGCGRIQRREATGRIDHEDRVGQRVQERRQLRPGRLDGGRRPRRPQTGGDLGAEGVERPASGGVGLLGHQQDESPRPVLHQREADGELGAGGELGDGGVGRGYHRDGGPRDQAGEPGVPAGRPEPVPVDPPPAHDLDAVGPGREAHEPGPGCEAGAGDVEGGGHHLVERPGGGDGGQAPGQRRAAVGLPGAGEHAGHRPGGQRQGGAVGRQGQGVRLQRQAAGARPAGHGQHGDDGAAAADRNGHGGEPEGRVGPVGGPSGGEGVAADLEQHRVRRADCHKRSQLPL